MIYFLRKAVLHGRRSIPVLSSLNLQFLPKNCSLLVYGKCFSTSNADNNPFVVSYLVNSCGLSQEHAVTAAKGIHFKTPKDADSVIAFLKDRGFSETQISTIIRIRPNILVRKPNETLLPKFDFFFSKGISSDQLAEILSKCPRILQRSLEKQLIPSFEFLDDFLKSKENTLAAIKQYGGILRIDLKGQMIPNINTLRENGVPESNIITGLRSLPIMFFKGTNQFRKTVKEVKEMGFNPLAMKFLLAVHVSNTMSRTAWVKKVNCYEKWGLSDEDVIMAFQRLPWFMALSEIKITEGMNYLTGVLGLKASFICKRPGLLLYSLNKRLIPRGSVAKVLLSKGLLTEPRLLWFFQCKEELFIEKFIKSYKKEAPELLKLYTEKLNLSKKHGISLSS